MLWFKRPKPQNLEMPPSGQLIGGIIDYQGQKLPIIDLCWIEEASGIVGSFAIPSIHHHYTMSFSGTGNLWINGWTFVGLEITGQRIGQLIHPGATFLSFTCSFIISEEGDIIGMAKRKTQMKRPKKSVLEKKAAKAAGSTATKSSLPSTKNEQ